MRKYTQRRYITSTARCHLHFTSVQWLKYIYIFFFGFEFMYVLPRSLTTSRVDFPHVGGRYCHIVIFLKNQKKLINWKICRNYVDRSLFKLSVPVLLVTWYHGSFFLLSPPGYQLLVFFKPKSRKTGLVLLFWLLKTLSGSKRSFCSVSVTIGFLHQIYGSRRQFLLVFFLPSLKI